MKKAIIIISVTLFILIDLCVLLYPTVSEYFNTQNESRVAARYMNDVAAMDDTKRQALLKAAQEYNKELPHMEDRFHLTKEEMAAYNEQLNTGNSIMGVLAIEKINVKLPIYHGTDAGVLQVGLGHMPGSSLPVGGKGTHAVITGHRGLPSSTLLTDLDKMAKGDTFVLYVMGETLTYQVDQILTVEPNEMQSLVIDPNMDYCTLVTCTPYGINTERLLVRGRRVPNAAALDWEASLADADQLDTVIVILIFLVSLVIPVFTIYAIIRWRKIRKEKNIYR